MRNEVALDLAGFSSAGSRTVQDNRTAAGNRIGQNNRRIPAGRSIQDSRTVTRNRAIQDKKAMAASRSIQDSRAVARSRVTPVDGTMARSRVLRDDRAMSGSRTLPDGRTAQSRRETAVPGDRRTMQQKLREQKRRKRIARQRMILAVLLGLICVCFVFLFKFLFGEDGSEEAIGGVRIQEGTISNVKNVAEHPAWTEDFLTVNEYSRPGIPLAEVNDIFVHYTANPNTNAVQNRSYFEQLKDTHERGASAHFIIGYEGDILQCIPLNEVAYAVKTRNEDSLSIECCYQNEDGSFTQETYDSLVELLAWLVHEYDLTTDNILRHYDCGGKKCPLYYTEHEDAWEQLKADVDKALLDL